MTLFDKINTNAQQELHLVVCPTHRILSSLQPYRSTRTVPCPVNSLELTAANTEPDSETKSSPHRTSEDSLTPGTDYTIFTTVTMSDFTDIVS